jgi:hypothetical protein
MNPKEERFAKLKERPNSISVPFPHKGSRLTQIISLVGLNANASDRTKVRLKQGNFIKIIFIDQHSFVKIFAQ